MIGTRVRTHRRARIDWSGPRAREIALGLFLAAAFLLGGGARDDIASLALLRPVAILAAAWALTLATRGDVACLRVPLALLGLLAAWIAVQLCPLPPAWWSALPGRAEIARADLLAGLPGLWRPISLSPTRTLNSLFALSVPLATLLLLGVQRGATGAFVARVLLALGVASALLGLAQMIGPQASLLYFYRVTNDLSAVGLFANRNHHGFLLAALMPFCACVAADALRREHAARRRAELIAAGGTAALFVLVVILTGSRAALVLMGGAVLAGGSLLAVAARRAGRLRGRAAPMLLGAALGVGVLMAAIVLLAPHIPGLERLMRGDTGGDIRFRALPTMWRMALDQMPVGAGFGAFEFLFRAYEPDALLSPTYMNQAHDDWLQLAIEGGMPALLIGLAALAGLAAAGLRAAAALRGGAPDATIRAAAACALIVLLLGSLTDYPLRVPSLMAMAAVCAVLTARRAETGVEAPGGLP